MERSKPVDAETFVRAWQAAPNAPAVVQALGMTLRTARERASKLRKKGVPLKHMRSGRHERLDYDALKALALELAPAAPAKKER